MCIKYKVFHFLMKKLLLSLVKKNKFNLMLFCHYYITNKYISISIFCKKKNTQYLLYQNSFLKNSINWLTFCKFFEEFLYEVGLKKYVIKHKFSKC